MNAIGMPALIPGALAVYALIKGIAAAIRAVRARRFRRDLARDLQRQEQIR